MSEPTKSKLLTYSDGDDQVYEQAKQVQREVGDVAPFVRDLDLPSVAVGFALSLGVLLALSIVRRTIGLVIKMALLALIVALIGGAYFGWLRGASATQFQTNEIEEGPR